VYDAVDTALSFATDDWDRPGALFYRWTVVGFHPSVPFDFISEPVRDLLIIAEQCGEAGVMRRLCRLLA
jgi:hypothetical protein